jgi:NADH-quinone oxidoreductase subunit L
MGGLRKYMPITWLTMCAGWLAICGVPIFAGFFSKDEILWKTWSASSPGIPPGFNKALWFVGAVTALLTAIYMTRLMVMTFWGSERFVAQADSLRDDHHAQHQPQIDNLRHTPHESPLSMTIPLVVLALLSTFGGLVGVPYALSSLTGGHPENYFERTLEPVISSVPEANASATEGPANLNWLSTPPQPVDGKPAVEVARATGQREVIPSAEEVSQERVFALISVLIALTGISIGWFMFQQPLRRMPRLLENKYYVDELYDGTIIQPILVVSRQGLWKIFDLGVIDGLIHGLGRTVIKFGKTVRYMQIGFVRAYAAIILAGAIIIIGYFAYNGAHVLRFLTR